jgi:N-acetylmuramic acid 6-phosphate etherase
MFHDAAAMQSEKPRILGIEGGGTKTEWVLVVDGVPLDRGVLAGSNLKLVTDDFLAHLFSVLPRGATHVGTFLAGTATEDDRRRLRGLVECAWPGARIAVGSDRDSAMATAFQDDDGIAVIAGTGAGVHGRLAGREEKAGGWGHVLGDRGSGYDLARQALRLVLTRYDLEQKITPLAERILRDLALNSLRELAEWAMQADKMSIARLAPAVFAASRQGEAEMLEVLQAGAGVLAEFTRAVAQRLNFSDPPVRLVGGLFAHHEEYVSLFKYRLSILLPEARVGLCEQSGAMGAAWLAERVSGEPVAVSSAAPAGREIATAEPELAQAATEQGNPRSAHLDAMTSEEIVELFVSEEDSVSAALTARREQLTAAVELVSLALGAKGRLFYVGAGTSGRLGVLDASEIPPTFGAPPELVQAIMAGGATALQRAVEGAEDQPQAGALAVFERGVRTGDVVCGITASGRTPFVLGALARARALGARTILLTCNPARATAGEKWDVEIDLPTGAEIVTGSTRLKAGTATKVALNILSTAAMVRLGRVRGNRMIDLGISNEKLRDRGTRIVAETLGLSYDEARTRLERAGWQVRACLESVEDDGAR